MSIEEVADILRRTVELFLTDAKLSYKKVTVLRKNLQFVVPSGCIGAHTEVTLDLRQLHSHIVSESAKYDVPITNISHDSCNLAIIHVSRSFFFKQVISAMLEDSPLRSISPVAVNTISNDGKKNDAFCDLRNYSLAPLRHYLGAGDNSETESDGIFQNGYKKNENSEESSTCTPPRVCKIQGSMEISTTSLIDSENRKGTIMVWVPELMLFDEKGISLTCLRSAIVALHVGQILSHNRRDRVISFPSNLDEIIDTLVSDATLNISRHECVNNTPSDIHTPPATVDRRLAVDDMKKLNTSNDTPSDSKSNNPPPSRRLRNEDLDVINNTPSLANLKLHNCNPSEKRQEDKDLDNIKTSNNTHNDVIFLNSNQRDKRQRNVDPKPNISGDHRHVDKVEDMLYKKLSQSEYTVVDDTRGKMTVNLRGYMENDEWGEGKKILQDVDFVTVEENGVLCDTFRQACDIERQFTTFHHDQQGNEDILCVWVVAQNRTHQLAQAIMLWRMLSHRTRIKQTIIQQGGVSTDSSQPECAKDLVLERYKGIQSATLMKYGQLAFDLVKMYQKLSHTNDRDSKVLDAIGAEFLTSANTDSRDKPKVTVTVENKHAKKSSESVKKVVRTDPKIVVRTDPKSSKPATVTSGELSKSELSKSDRKSDNKSEKLSEKSERNVEKEVDKLTSVVGDLSGKLSSVIALLAKRDGGDRADINVEQYDESGDVSDNENAQVEESQDDCIDRSLEAYEAYYDDTATLGDLVDDKLQKVTKAITGHALSDDKVKEKQALYPRPSNCDSLVTTKLNKEFYFKVSYNAKQPDFKLQDVQTDNVFAMTAAVKGADVLIKNMRSNTVSFEVVNLAVSNIFDSVAFMNKSNQAITAIRKERLKYEFSPDYRSLLYDNEDVASCPAWLFGDDVPTRLKKIEETNKATNRATQSRSNYGPVRSHDYRGRQARRGHVPYNNAAVVVTDRRPTEYDGSFVGPRRSRGMSNVRRRGGRGQWRSR